uniref:Uncharacterized protein n=1 Tax=Timema cristinae TaxID=61476 RepID=A0A7R9CN17_TIMCR|nr:unnamed protein product [Timema cristinae]
MRRDRWWVTHSELMLPGNAQASRNFAPADLFEKELLHTTSAQKTTDGHDVSGVGLTTTSKRKPLLRNIEYHVRMWRCEESIFKVRTSGCSADHESPPPVQCTVGTTR